MNRKALRQKLLLWAACGVGVSLLLTREFVVGFLSPRELGIALIVFFFATLVVLKRVFTVGVTMPSQTVREGTPIDSSTREQRLRDIRKLRIAVAALVLLLLIGLWRYSGNIPRLQLLVLVGINLFITVTIIRAIRRLQSSLK